MEYAQRIIGSKQIRCSKCNVIMSTITNFKVHLNSNKHMQKKKEAKTKEVIHQCKICEKVYESRSGLWKHVQKCKVKSNEATIEDMSENMGDMSKKIDELKEAMEMMKENPSVINNITNNEFNVQIQVFLDTKCKNADNLDNMLENYLAPRIKDLLTLANGDITSTMSNICANTLTNYETTNRPMHCFASKEDPLTIKLRIKDKDTWVSEKDSIDLFIEMVNCLEPRLKSVFYKWAKDCKNLLIMDEKTFIAKLNERNRAKLNRELLRNIERILMVDEDDMECTNDDL